MHIRQGYWIIQGRSAVKKVVNQCRIYCYFKTTSLVQKIALLPEDQWHHPQCWHNSIDFLGPLYIKNEFQEAEKARVVQHVQYISSSHAAWPPKVFYWLWQGWCQEEARLTWFGLTILNHLKTLTMSSANAGKLSKAISHRKGSRVVVFIGSSFALVNWRNVDNT